MRSQTAVPKNIEQMVNVYSYSVAGWICCCFLLCLTGELRKAKEREADFQEHQLLHLSGVMGIKDVASNRKDALLLVGGHESMFWATMAR